MNRNGYDSEAMNELIHKYLSGETTPEESREVETWLSEHPEEEVKFREMEGVRSALRRSVQSQSTPSDLREAVLKKTIGSNLIPLEKSEGGAFRLSYLYGAAAVVLLLVIGWFALQSPKVAPSVDPPQIAQELKSVTEVLRVGVNDHLRCAVTFYKGDIEEYGIEKMKAKLAQKKETLEEDFSALIPIVQQQVDEGKLLVAHKCSFGGRNYVHMILQSEKGKVSLVITRKQDGESLADREGAVATVEGIPIYQASLEGYKVAGFDADRFLVYVASDLPDEANLTMISAIAMPVKDVLKAI